MSDLKQLQEELENQIKYFDISFGDKTIQAKIWTAKELIDYDKQLKMTKDVLVTIHDTLVYPVLSDISKNIYLTQEEILYVVTIIREKTFIGMPLTYLFECTSSGCLHNEEIKIAEYTRTNNMYMNSELELSNGLTFNIGDIQSVNAVKSKTENSSYEITFIEMLLRIKAIEFDNITYDVINFDELKDMILSLPGNIYDELTHKYRDFVFSDIINNQIHVCPVCGTGNKIYLNDVTIFLRDI